MPDHAPHPAPPSPASAPSAAPADLLDVLAPALRPVRDDGSLDAALGRLAHGAVRLVPELDEAAFVVGSAQWECRAATGAVVRELVAAEVAGGDGPAHASARLLETRHLPRRQLEQEWRALGDLAARRGVRAVVCVPLVDQARAHGVLVATAGDVSLATDSRRLLETLAAAAAAAVERLTHQHDVARALESRSLIGQAIGIVRERYDLTQDRAWDYLVRQASTREVKVAAIARELVDERATQ